MIQWRDELLQGGGNVFFIMVNTGHALPLPGGRSSCPRRSRGGDSAFPRENNDLSMRTRPVHVADPATDRSQSRTVHVHKQVRPGTVRSQALATDANRPWTVHGLGLPTS